MKPFPKTPKIKRVNFNINHSSSLPFLKQGLLALLIVLATISLVLILLEKLPPQVPIFFGLPKSEAQLTSSIGLLIPSFISGAIVVFNLVVIFFIKEDFFKKALIMASYLCVFFSTIATIKIILLFASF